MLHLEKEEKDEEEEDDEEIRRESKRATIHCHTRDHMTPVECVWDMAYENWVSMQVPQ